MLSIVKEELTISKVENDTFRFTGLDVKVVEDRIEVMMNDYTQSLEDIKDVRKAD